MFWINLPLLGVAFIGAWLLLGYDKPEEKRSFQMLRKVDWIGLNLFVLSGVGVLTPLSYVGSLYPWDSLPVILPLTIGVMGLAILGWYQTKVASRPLFRPSMFRNYSTVFQFTNIMVHGALMWMTIYYMSLFYLGVRGASPLMTGVWALPATLTVAPMAAIVGQAASRTGHYRPFLVVGWVLLVPIYCFMTLIGRQSPDRHLIPIIVFIGLAFGSLVPAMSAGVQATVSRADQGHAVAMMYILRSGGQALGIAVGQSVFSSRLRTLLGKHGFDRDAVQGLLKNMRNSKTRSGDIGLKQVNAVVCSLHSVWLTAFVMAAVATVLAICARCPQMPEDDELEQVAAQPSSNREIGA
jgi:hypothetical protein